MEKHTKCQQPGCTSPGHFKNGVECFRKGYCNKHYTRFLRHGDPETVLKVQNTGNKKHSLYNTWSKIKDRTSNPNNKDYPNYGGRGIQMCDRWQGPNGFDNFVADMGERPPNTTLDRKANDGPYSLENCRWATRHQQQANKRNNNKTVGVGWDKRSSKWRARVVVEGRQKNLGYFTNYEDAITARKAAEVLLH